MVPHRSQPERYQLQRGNGEIRLEARPGIPDESWAATMNVADAKPFQGQRIKLTAEVKTEAVAGGSSAWLRIDDSSHRDVGFDNQAQVGFLRGSQDWTERTIVLDVPPEGATLNYGSLQVGRGATSIRNVRIEQVDPSTPLTVNPEPTGASPRSSFQAR